MKQVITPFIYLDKIVCFVKAIKSEIPHYYLYDINKSQIGGAIVGDNTQIVHIRKTA